MRVELHRLGGDKRAGELARLVESLWGEGRRIVVWVADDARRSQLDDYLWTFRQQSFVPHRTWTAELGEMDDPVVLLGEAANPNRATVLVVGDDLPPPEALELFEEVHDLLPPGAAGEERRGWWEERSG